MTVLLALLITSLLSWVFVSSDSGQYSTADLDTLQLVHVIFRHGDRTPIDQYPSNPYNNLSYWPEGWGQLTKRGKNMHYNLGQYFRTRYDGFISRVYTPDQIYVQSSDVDRTIMSAMSNLAGLFPPTEEDPKSIWNPDIKWQPIPVHPISKPIDNKIGFYQSCPKYKKLLDEFLSGAYMQEFDKNSTELYKYLSTHTGLNISNYNPVSDIYDTLFIENLYNLTLPEWTKQVFPDKMLPSALIWVQKFTFTDQLKRLRTIPFLKEIVNNMDRHVGYPGPTGEEKHTYPPKAKFYMYAGHDNTISALLDTFGLFTPHISPYATSLIFELHKKPEDQEYFVKIFYRPHLNKEPAELEYKACGSPCYLNKLKELKKDHLLDAEAWRKECEVTEKDITDAAAPGA